MGFGQSPGAQLAMSSDTVIAFIGAPYDGAATLGWPGARYAPGEVRRHLDWMRMRVQEGRIYWIDEDRIVPVRPEQLLDAGDASVVPHDLVASLAAVRTKTREQTAAGRVPAVVGGDDSILFPAVAGFHDAVGGQVAVVHFDAHLDLLDESPAQGRFSQSSGMRRALELPRVDARSRSGRATSTSPRRSASSTTSGSRSSPRGRCSATAPTGRSSASGP